MEEPLSSHGLERRRLLLGLGAAVVAGLAPSSLWRVAPADAALLADHVAPGGTGPTYCMSRPTYDTMAGLAAWVLPGDDAYSATQGVTDPRPGAVAAGAPQFLTMAFNQVLLDPTAITLLLDRLADLFQLVELPDDVAACERIGSAIEQEGAVPLAPVIVALVNAVAVSVRPSSAAGPHAAPFARLSWAEKAETWRRLEQDVPRLLKPRYPAMEAPVVGRLLELNETLGGIIEYASGVAPMLAGFFGYSETLVYDRAARRLVDRPIGWDLSNHLPGRLWPVDGWDEFQGYYQGRSSVDA
ncbi:hypothetical protein H9L21_05480 [Aeromicrobium senzhongii]|uniref:Gluconate 2-dehydrogenase subunit 3 family protein n=1 Tax=Aeromicrobium senzhongii TaxID=2663859 RepID=A0ABX6SVE1_9ACTN|nr:hypothetical protein [Aeromicrobium senzhongii]MTB87585.1 hypothetical protein [Aeromicrobium senzhongii]QNL95374.1 hypothetical protein H9L21_05480 [Aeromicrobium senzhongii]